MMKILKSFNFIILKFFEHFDLFLQFDWLTGNEISSGWTTLKHRIDKRQK
jgi:hypothetical protein